LTIPPCPVAQPRLSCSGQFWRPGDQGHSPYPSDALQLSTTVLFCCPRLANGSAIRYRFSPWSIHGLRSSPYRLGSPPPSHRPRSVGAISLSTFVARPLARISRALPRQRCFPWPQTCPTPLIFETSGAFFLFSSLFTRCFLRRLLLPFFRYRSLLLQQVFHLSPFCRSFRAPCWLPASVLCIVARLSCSFSTFVFFLAVQPWQVFPDCGVMSPPP